jgi:tetratricopeptide (TPR) repeat protein
MFREGLLKLLLSLGLADEAEVHLREAEKVMRQSIAQCEKWVADSPEKADYRHHLASLYNALGALLKNTGRIPEAEQAYSRSPRE